MLGAIIENILFYDKVYSLLLIKVENRNSALQCHDNNAKFVIGGQRLEDLGQNYYTVVIARHNLDAIFIPQSVSGKYNTTFNCSLYYKLWAH